MRALGNRARLGGVLAVWLACGSLPAASLGANSSAPGTLTVRIPMAGEKRRVDLDRPAERDTLRALAQQRAREASRAVAARKEARRRMREARPLAELSVAELKEYYREPAPGITERDRRGWEIIDALCQELEHASRAEKLARARQVQEVLLALHNNTRPPAPRSIDLIQLPCVLWDYHHNPIARGTSPAQPLINPPGETTSDLSRWDPEPSSFWTPPRDIAAQDLFAGFGRPRRPDPGNEICLYHGPKTSYGGNPGFEVRWRGAVLKVKFAETTSEPFAARIFAVLGYHVEPTDHAPFLKIQYDRRLLREFHLRKEVGTSVRLLGFIPLHRINLQPRFHALDFITAAVLTNGEQIATAELKRRLFRRPGVRHPEDDPANFRPAFEGQIAYLVTRMANIQVKDSALESIGPWDFGQADHAQRRELRAAGLLGAWLGWFDSRFENTRLKLVRSPRGVELKHYFTDLGGGLGQAIGPVSRCAEAPHKFGWVFTRPLSLGDPADRLRIVGYEPIEDTPAFEDMTVDDARWMARLIVQFSEAQLDQALRASGCDDAQTQLYLEKLISRRDHLIRHLGLAQEIAGLRPDGSVAQRGSW